MKLICGFLLLLACLSACSTARRRRDDPPAEGAPPAEGDAAGSTPGTAAAGTGEKMCKMCYSEKEEDCVDTDCGVKSVDEVIGESNKNLTDAITDAVKDKATAAVCFAGKIDDKFHLKGCAVEKVGDQDLCPFLEGKLNASGMAFTGCGKCAAAKEVCDPVAAGAGAGDKAKKNEATSFEINKAIYGLVVLTLTSMMFL